MSDYHDEKERVLSLLEQLATVAAASGSANVERSIRHDMLERVREERFHVVFVGEFNHGKSTLVNAIVGQRVLPTGVTPTTALVHRVEHGTRLAAWAVRDQADDEDIPVTSLQDYVVNPGQGGDAPVPDEIRIQLSAAFLEDGVVLVDTPGVNELNQQRWEVAHQHIPRADALVVCLDAGQVLKRSELEFLRTRVPPEARGRLWFVVNKADLLDARELDEALAYVDDQLKTVVDRPRIYPVSAQQALETGGEAEGLNRFKEALRLDLSADRGRAVLDNALAFAGEAEQILSGSLEAQREALTLDQGELERRLNILNQELSGTVDGLKGKERELRDRLGQTKGRVIASLERFREQFSEALVAEADRATTEDLRRYLHGFVEEHVQRVAQEQAEYVVGQLRGVAEEAVAFVDRENRAQLDRLKEVLGLRHSALDLSVNTLPYDLGVFAVGATGLTVMAVSNVLVGGALALAAPVMAVLFRGRADRLLKERAKEVAPDSVRSAVTKLEEAFSAQIDEFGDSLFGYLERARAQVLASTQGVVQKVAETKRQGGEAIAALDAANAGTLEALTTLRGEIALARKALWADAEIAD